MNTKQIGRTAVRTAETVAEGTREIGGAILDRFGGKNPLLVRKKFEMQDVYYRKKDPDRELFRIEMGCDTELWVLALGAAILLFYLAHKLSKIEERRRIRRARRKS
ncbi:MAG: hypothetical protein IKQ87_06965 [Clostridia bacterium]|nr:hypothetical protein [Clostridia bacterium]